METLHRRCAGLDVHQKEIVACRRIVSGRKAGSELGRFPTTTPGLVALSAWLAEARVTHVAMEATGVYWKPVWHVLCQDFKLILANASHIRNVPGRKSDANYATWIADLLAHGLIRASFVPPQPIQDLRDLTRTRRELTREVVRHTQRIEATLEEANIKLTSVISDILGLSGRRILKAIVVGENDPRQLVELAHPRLACAREDLAAALQERLRDHHRFLIDQHLKTIEQIEATIAEFDIRLEAALSPFRGAVERLTDIPGVGDNVAQHTWFKTLPLWLDFGQFRVVHACWNDDYISRLKPHLGPGNTLTDKLIVSANRKGNWAFEAIEALCKGLEINLPDGKSGKDKRRVRDGDAEL